MALFDGCSGLRDVWTSKTMRPNKASKVKLDVVTLIIHMLRDIQRNHAAMFSEDACAGTVERLRRRCASEGLSFLTKTLPTLAKAFDKSLACGAPLNATELGWEALPDSELPRFLGEFFTRVLHSDGTVLQDPCIVSIRVIRQIAYSFYKYELPYTSEQEQKVIDGFIKSEGELVEVDQYLANHADVVHQQSTRLLFEGDCHLDLWISRRARRALSCVFAGFDPTDIYPSHGPGAVSTRERLQEKWEWLSVADSITQCYPVDEYFYPSLTAVCDEAKHLMRLRSDESPARVILVPKDSRGPRLISCEPCDKQYVQQGLRRAIYQRVESHPLTREHVYFTNQNVNRWAALRGSRFGEYATIDLKEASDRVSLELVKLLFPSGLIPYLEACRSSQTELPSGERLTLRKFAPMGSALCFPIMALTIWSLLHASAPDQDTRESILVYGDDVIVPAAFAEYAIAVLQHYGLRANVSKCCLKGFFRESCGVDAYKGHDVTPLKLKTVWTESPSPSSYMSWVAYANSLYDMKYFTAYDYIVSLLAGLYWPIADSSVPYAQVQLREAPSDQTPIPKRWNKNLQRFQYKTLGVRSVAITRPTKGWTMLLRYFLELADRSDGNVPIPTRHPTVDYDTWVTSEASRRPVDASQYTKRGASILAPSWQ